MATKDIYEKGIVRTLEQSASMDINYTSPETARCSLRDATGMRIDPIPAGTTPSCRSCGDLCDDRWGILADGVPFCCALHAVDIWDSNQEVPS